MALTPEDVINKRFQPTKFREGYDQDEVDDFLDEIVVELRRLNQENSDLRQQLETGTGAVADDSTAQTTTEETAPAVETEEEVAQPIVAEDAAGAAGEPVDRATAPGAGDAQSAAGVLVMAQRLHDEYVAKGQAEHDRLTADGQSEYDRLLSEAQRSKDEVLTSLESERGALQEKVDHLRGFEQTYRVKLKEFISGQLNDIDAAPPVEDDVAAIVGELPADEPQVQGATDAAPQAVTDADSAADEGNPEGTSGQNSAS